MNTYVVSGMENWLETLYKIIRNILQSCVSQLELIVCFCLFLILLDVTVDLQNFEVCYRALLLIWAGNGQFYF